jgi:hypothetical protein
LSRLIVLVGGGGGSGGDQIVVVIAVICRGCGVLSLSWLIVVVALVVVVGSFGGCIALLL